MTIEFINIVLFFLTLASAFVVFWNVVVVMGKNREFLLSERFLAAFLFSFLFIISEVFILSQFPIIKPLHYLWLFHVVAVSLFVLLHQ